ncbi:MAG: hypothetical protein ABIO76_01585 [Ginsengibacter sp.]
MKKEIMAYFIKDSLQILQPFILYIGLHFSRDMHLRKAVMQQKNYMNTGPGILLLSARMKSTW